MTNTAVVNTETMCELRRKIAALGLTGPITLVLDNARRHPAFAEFRAAIEHTLAGLSTTPTPTRWPRS